MPMEALFDDPVALRWIEGLADLGRLVLFDRCGIGLSDPPPDSDHPTFARGSRDIEAVVAAAEVRQSVLVSQLLGVSVTFLYSDRHPDEVGSLVLVNPSPIRFDGSLIRAQLDGELDSAALVCPSRADEPGFREWFNRAGQRGASPGLAARAYPEPDDAEVCEIEQAAARIRVPTLVLRSSLHQLSPPPASDPVLALVRGAVRVDLPGEDAVPFGDEVHTVLAEITRFVTGKHRPPAPECVLAAVLCSDLVASTERMTALGDTRWKRVLDRHDAIARSCIARRGGTVIKTTGDGVLAILPSATNAVRAAHELRGALEQEQLEVRVGIHVGDVHRRREDISGVGVVIAARIQGFAAAGEILASGTAVAAMTGESLAFEPRGEHQLKGVPGTWPTFAAVPSD
jgi:class 3 adenylate cyclase